MMMMLAVSALRKAGQKVVDWITDPSDPASVLNLWILEKRIVSTRLSLNGGPPILGYVPARNEYE
jgi:hypothetical protein